MRDDDKALGELSSSTRSARITEAALAEWLSGLECCPVHQSIAGLIPSQGSYLGCGFDPWLSA